MRIDEQPRTRWPDPSAFRNRRPDLRLGSRRHRIDQAGTTQGRIAVQHTVRTATAEYTLLLNAPEWLGRRGVGEALRDSVAELRAVDLTYGPNRPDSLVSMLRRGEISPESYPPLADLVDRCTAMRAATDGWFDAWAVPGGFDPGGLLGGWAVERAAARLRAAGIHDYAVLAGADLVVRGHAPHGGPWRVAVHHPTAPDRAPLVLGDDRRRHRHLRGHRPAGARGGPAHRRTGQPTPRRDSRRPGPDGRRRLRHRALRRRPHRPRLVPWRLRLSRALRSPALTEPRRSERRLPAAPRRVGVAAAPRPPAAGRSGDAIGPHGRGNGCGGRSATSARGSHNRGVRRPVGPGVDHATRRRAGASTSASDRSRTLANRRNSTQESPQRTVTDAEWRVSDWPAARQFRHGERRMARCPP